MLKSLFVPDHFESNELLLLVVKTFNSLAKAATTKFIYNLKSVAEMVANYNVIVATVVIIAIIILFA